MMNSLYNVISTKHILKTKIPFIEISIIFEPPILEHEECNKEESNYLRHNPSAFIHNS